MYYSIYPTFDATMYEFHEEMNTGVDQILELQKIAMNSKAPDGTFWAGSFNSRILLTFDLTELSASIVSNAIPINAKYYLKLWHANATDLPTAYDIYAYPVSESWTNGNGNYGDIPIQKEGVSWKYRTGKQTGELWNSGSNVDYNYQSNVGGGNWYTGSGYEASHSFQFDNPDLRMNVTDIVNKWLTSDIPNNGFILKRTNLDESGSSIFGSVKYFGRETHTVYIPRLEVTWDDSNLSGTGSFTEIGDDAYSVHARNIKPSYSTNSRARIRFGVRDTYPTRTYSTSSNYLLSKRLPTSSFYSVKDYATGDTIVPFDSNTTIVSCDSRGNYIDVRMNAFLPERFYEIQLKVEREGGNMIEILNDTYLFKIRK